MTNQLQNYLCSLPDNVDKIDISFITVKDITELDLTRFTHVTSFICAHCELKELPKLPDTLLFLNCYSNNIIYLPLLPAKLISLYCSRNMLGSLPNLPRSIEEICCVKNHITELPELPSSLEFLCCGNNRLLELRKLPSSLLHLECSNNFIKQLPQLPSKLQCLECINNFIRVIPSFPSELRSIHCSNNLIYNLPLLPINLQEFYCENNFATEFFDETDEIENIIDDVNSIYKFRHFYYSLKFKCQFKKWLWEKVRQPKIQSIYSPENVLRTLEKIQEDDDINDDEVNYDIIERVSSLLEIM